MALDQNAKYPVGTAPATAAYPEGEAVNSTAPGALDGYPLEKDQLNDRFGLEQALLRAGGQAASGLPDTALVSQYMQMIVELASGRAFNYDDSGAADAYILDVQANQQAPQSLFDGEEFNFIPANTGTGAAATANPAGLGATSIKIVGGLTNPAAGQITAGKPAKLVYRLLPAPHLELEVNPFETEFISAEQTITSAGALTIAHGLPAAPKLIQLRLICKIADAGYAVNDEVIVDFPAADAASNYGISIIPDATNINVRYGSQATVFLLTHKTTGIAISAINANWRLIVRAWA